MRETAFVLPISECLLIGHRGCRWASFFLALQSMLGIYFQTHDEGAVFGPGERLQIFQRC